MSVEKYIRLKTYDICYNYLYVILYFTNKFTKQEIFIILSPNLHPSSAPKIHLHLPIDDDKILYLYFQHVSLLFLANFIF